VLLVTHATQYLNAVDAVLVMYEGRLAFNGPYAELRREVEADESTTTKRRNSRCSDDEARTLRSVLSGLTARAQEDEQQAANELPNAGPAEAPKGDDDFDGDDPLEARVGPAASGPVKGPGPKMASAVKKKRLGTTDSVLQTTEKREMGGVGLKVLTLLTLFAIRPLLLLITLLLTNRAN
jgi:ABC-type glutathione transport system ATPase component